jgi:hypothetical protein
MHTKRLFLLGIVGILFLIPIQFAHAHEGEEEAAEDLGVAGIIVTVHPSEALQNDEIPIEAVLFKEGDPLAGQTIFLTVDKHDAGLSVRLPAAEREPGRYVAKYRFEKPGEYEIHVEVSYKGSVKRSTRYITVRGNFPITAPRVFAIGTGVLALAIMAWGITKKRLKSGAIGALIALAAGGIAYSLYVTLTSGAASRGVVTCVTPDDCFLTAHIHTYVPIEICGKELRLPIEKGSLTGPHTHEEKNIIHWHDRLPYDNAAKKLKETDPLKLGVFFDAIEIPFDLERIDDHQNGNLCEDGQPGFLKMFVNGTERGVQRDYVWSDKDVIFIVFDSRLPAEVEAWLKTNPIAFPTLGRG